MNFRGRCEITIASSCKSRNSNCIYQCYCPKNCQLEINRARRKSQRAAAPHGRIPSHLSKRIKVKKTCELQVSKADTNKSTQISKGSTKKGQVCSRKIRNARPVNFATRIKLLAKKQVRLGGRRIGGLSNQSSRSSDTSSLKRSAGGVDWLQVVARRLADDQDIRAQFEKIETPINQEVEPIMAEEPVYSELISDICMEEVFFNRFQLYSMCNNSMLDVQDLFFSQDCIQYNGSTSVVSGPVGVVYQINSWSQDHPSYGWFFPSSSMHYIEDVGL